MESNMMIDHEDVNALQNTCSFMKTTRPLEYHKDQSFHIYLSQEQSSEISDVKEVINAF